MASQYFFTGAAVLLNALGGHSIAIEMMDAMETPSEVKAGAYLLFASCAVLKFYPKFSACAFRDGIADQSSCRRAS